MNSSPNSDRSRLARELHDGLAQELAAIGYQLDSVIGRQYLDQDSRTDLRLLRSNISAITDQVRNEIFELRNENGLGFLEILKTQLQTLLTGHQIAGEISGECQLNKESQYEIIRCVRELILNSIAHSRCSEIKITLSPGEIIYEDNGSFNEATSANNYGLIGMQERLIKVGGSMVRNGSTFIISL